MGAFRDLTGKKYNRLTVLRLAEKRGKNYYYECQCDCGNKKLIRAGQITSGGTKSCGCLQREWAKSPKTKEHNQYEIDENVAKVKMSNTGEIMLCDIEDWDIMKDNLWFVDKYGYASANVEIENGLKRVRKFHVLIMGKKDGLVIDHINRNALDNRRVNLRFVTQHANTTNQGLRKNNTSGCTGVKFRKDTKRWSASIMLDGKSIALGCYDTKDEAIAARKRGEETYFEPLFSVGG